MKYAVIEIATNKVLNIIIWDGISEYNPGPGLLLVLATEQHEIEFSEFQNNQN